MQVEAAGEWGISVLVGTASCGGCGATGVEVEVEVGVGVARGARFLQ